MSILNHCPYCADQVEGPRESGDHLFPRFLGGKQTINACRTCNSRFGHTFEAGSAKFLKAFHVFIGTCGVRMKSASQVWRSSFEYDGKLFDLKATEEGTKTRLSRPKIKRDEKGKVVLAEFPEDDTKSGEHFVKSLAERGITSKPTQVVRSKVNFKGVSLKVNIGSNEKCLALKMCMALSTMLPGFITEEVSQARSLLFSDPTFDVREAYITYQPINSRRPGLSHTIYVERNSFCVYGVVQFFGAIQLYCPLGVPQNKAPAAGLLASLDPVTGDENINQVPPQYLPAPPTLLQTDQLPTLIRIWLEKLEREAVERGGKNPGLILSNVTPRVDQSSI